MFGKKSGFGLVHLNRAICSNKVGLLFLVPVVTLGSAGLQPLPNLKKPSAEEILFNSRSSNASFGSDAPWKTWLRRRLLAN